MQFHDGVTMYLNVTFLTGAHFSDFQFFANINTRENYYWCKNFACVLIVWN